MPVRGFVSFFSVLSIVSCVSDPTFEQANDATTATDTTVSTTRDMVLVPATTLTTLTTKESKGKGKGQSGDDDDDNSNKKPSPAPPAPAPAPASPPPAASSGSMVVPAFWMDAAAVTRADYDACVNSAACSPASCVSLGDTAACITHAQASTYCVWRDKRMVRDAEWTSAANQMPAGLTGLSGGLAEWVDADASSGIVRGGATANASMTLGLASSMPTVGFRCARDR